LEIKSFQFHFHLDIFPLYNGCTSSPFSSLLKTNFIEDPYNKKLLYGSVSIKDTEKILRLSKNQNLKQQTKFKMFLGQFHLIFDKNQVLNDISFIAILFEFPKAGSTSYHLYPLDLMHFFLIHFSFLTSFLIECPNSHP